MALKVTKWDDNLISGMDNITLPTYENDTDNYSNVPWRPLTNPDKNWALPYVTNHKYKIHWGFGLDFSQMHLDLGTPWLPTDYDIQMVFNFTDVRAAVLMKTDKDIIPNNTINTIVNADYKFGDNVVYNDT